MQTHLKSYKELIVWQKSIEIVKEVYFVSSKFPKDEFAMYGVGDHTVWLREQQQEQITVKPMTLNRARILSTK